jgi:hypothetical protein
MEGGISIAIESNSGSPHFRQHGVVKSSPTEQRLRSHGRMNSPPARSESGASARRARGGEIPSTPGSSPAKLKKESDAGDAMMIDEDVDLGEPMEQSDNGQGNEMDFDDDDFVPHVSQMGSLDYESKMKRREKFATDQHMDDAPDQPMQDDVGFGPNTQNLFEPDIDEDFTVPNLEFPSPAEIASKKPHVKRLIEKMDVWVAKKAKQYHIDEEHVWYALERTGGLKKIANFVLRKFHLVGGRVQDHGISFLRLMLM